MNTINSKLVALGAVCLLSACGVQDQAAQVKDQVQALGGTQELAGMAKGVGQTLQSVQSGDFDAAKQEFSSVQEGWKKASTQLNANPETINNIKGNVQTIATDLQASPPDKAKLVGNLKTLSGSLGNLAKGAGTNGAADSTQTFNDNLLAMKDAVAKTNTAVEASDFSTAQTSFSEARQTWFSFGGIVKEKSADSYQTLDQGVKNIHTTLGQAEPAQDTLLTDLETIKSELETVSKQ